VKGDSQWRSGLQSSGYTLPGLTARANENRAEDKILGGRRISKPCSSDYTRVLTNNQSLYVCGLAIYAIISRSKPRRAFEAR
jgi:hypothetical protein